MSNLLRNVIADLQSTQASLCIVAKRPWHPDCEAMLVELTEDYRVPVDVLSQGYEYFLGVSSAREEVLGPIGPKLTAEQRVAAILYYAENDAYPEWLNALYARREG